MDRWRVVDAGFSRDASWKSCSTAADFDLMNSASCLRPDSPTDGTCDYLRSLPDIRVIANPDNRGFPAAANQGMKLASGDSILLLNNDTVVTTGWLRRMLDAIERDSQIGLVGPCSNFVSGPQQVTRHKEARGPINYSETLER
jgi:GT2 family glycosyltransferase